MLQIVSLVVFSCFIFGSSGEDTIIRNLRDWYSDRYNLSWSKSKAESAQETAEQTVNDGECPDWETQRANDMICYKKFNLNVQDKIFRMYTERFDKMKRFSRDKIRKRYQSVGCGIHANRSYVAIVCVFRP
ncbi:hypothetical protein ACHWQZ_G019455 [Mnemiopsis leidyi]